MIFFFIIALQTSIRFSLLWTFFFRHTYYLYSKSENIPFSQLHEFCCFFSSSPFSTHRPNNYFCCQNVPLISQDGLCSFTMPELWKHAWCPENLFIIITCSLFICKVLFFFSNIWSPIIRVTEAYDNNYLSVKVPYNLLLFHFNKNNHWISIRIKLKIGLLFITILIHR